MLSLTLDHLPRPKPLGTFRGHSEIVWSVIFFPSGREFASASNDGSIRLWNLDHTSEVILGNGNAPVFCLALFPDGKRLASGGLDRSIKVWDIDVLGTVEGPWRGHTSSVRYLDISADCRYLASGSFDHKVNIWDTRSGHVVRDESHLTGDQKINCVKFSQKDCKLLTGSGDGCLRIWNWESGDLLVGPIQADDMPIWAIAWSHDETQVLSGSGNGVLCRWRASTGRIVGEPVHAHKSIIYSLFFSHNGGCLASASSDSTVKVWNATTFQQMAVLEHPDEVNCIAFSSDDRLLATACSDSSVYVWEIPQASLDSGLVIDKECDDASLLERPIVKPIEGDVVVENKGGSETDIERLREILGTKSSPFPPQSTKLDKKRPIEVVTRTAGEERDHPGFPYPHSRYLGGVSSMQEPKKPRRKLSQMIKRAFTKSCKFLSSLW